VRQRKVNLFQSCCLRKATNFSSVRSDWKAVGDKAPSITLSRCLWLTEIATAVAACATYRQGLPDSHPAPTSLSESSLRELIAVSHFSTWPKAAAKYSTTDG
jgi:hypothetical protein